MYVCIYVCTCMYVCMFLCIYVCMYVTMYVSMYICIYVCAQHSPFCLALACLDLHNINKALQEVINMPKRPPIGHWCT